VDQLGMWIWLGGAGILILAHAWAHWLMLLGWWK
jgi:hypothetical protein